MFFKNKNKEKILKKTILHCIKKALKKEVLKYVYDLVDINKVNFTVECCKNEKFGDYSTNVAMCFQLPRDKVLALANAIANELPKNIFSKVDVAEPGFINMFINNKENTKIINQILKEHDKYGKFKSKKDWYNIEFVSANPTGLIHIAHARNASFGETIAKIWENYGISVNREYYINDAGNQINKLGMSTLVRYKQLFGKKDELPEDSYHGAEIQDVAMLLKEQFGDKYLNTKYDDNGISDKEANEFISTFAKNYMLDTIKKTLINLGVIFDIWTSEKHDIVEKGLIPKALKKLKDNVYVKDGATWLKTTSYGDDKDRVIIKSNGENTYFAPDIAYHYLKLSRGYTKIFNVWGTDHKSYADRLKIAIQLLEFKPDKITTFFQQMIRLTKNGEEFKMSKRSGNSLTAQDLIDAIGKDAARWYLVSQSFDSHLDIDVDKATSTSNANALYYVQYAHARINQLLSKEKYQIPDNFNDLINPIEISLLNKLNDFKPTLENIATKYEIHQLNKYLFDLARTYHSYYSTVNIINNGQPLLSAQRYYLSKAVKQVIKNGLALLGIEALEKMVKNEENK